MSDATEEQSGESLFPAEWPGDGRAADPSVADVANTPGPSVSGALPGAAAGEPATPAGNPGSGALPPIFPPLAPLPANAPATSEAAPTTTPGPDAEATITAKRSALDVETTTLRSKRSALDVETTLLDSRRAASEAETTALGPDRAAAEVETTLLGSSRAAAEIETTVLGSKRSAPESETELLTRPLPGQDGAGDRPAPPRPAIIVETERLAGAFPAPDQEAERLRREQSSLDQQDTERLTREQLDAQIETERLKHTTPIDQEETEPLRRGRPVDEEDTERLKRVRRSLDQEDTERLKRSGDIYINPSARPWGEQAPTPRYQPGAAPLYTEPLVDENALQEEATAALNLFAPAPPLPAPVMPAPVTPSRPVSYGGASAPSVPRVSSHTSYSSVPSVPGVPGVPNEPSAPGASSEDAGMVTEGATPPKSGRPDESLVRALRGVMYPRLSLGKRALALFSEPDMILVALFALAQIAFTAIYPWTGPRPGESNTLALASRIAQGDGLSATTSAFGQYAGAPLWAVFAGVGSLLGGALGARVIAILFTSAAGLATARAAKNLFGATAGVFTAALFALSGPLLYFAHLAIPDQMTLLGVALSLWAITQAEYTHRAEWLVVAAAIFFITVLAQFAALPLIIPLALVALALRAQPSYAIFSITGLVILALLAARFAPPPVAIFTILFSHTPGRLSGLSLSASVSAAGIQLLTLGIVAWGVAIAGWIAAHERGRLAASLFTGLLFAPATIALMGGAADAGQRMVSGLLFGLPLMSLALTALWLGSERFMLARRVIVVALLLGIGAVGILQANGLALPSGLRPTYNVSYSSKAEAPAPQIAETEIRH